MREQVAVEIGKSSQRQAVGEAVTGSLSGEEADSWSAAQAKAWGSGGGNTCHQLSCLKYMTPLRPSDTSALIATETETQNA